MLLIRCLDGPQPFPYTTLFRSQEVEEKRPQARSLDGAGGHRRDVFLVLRAAPVSAALAASAAYSASKSVAPCASRAARSEEHTSELQSREKLVCRLLLEKNKGE